MRSVATAMAAVLFGTSTLLGGPTAVKDSPSDVPNWPVPKPVEFLTPEAAISRMKLAPGFHIEVVAAEPMVQHPVAMSFDEDGRLWVVEMRGYMPDAEGAGEDKPTGRISVLEDTDGDGRMDKSTVFMDNLVLPRAISCVRGGALVAVPPKLMFCRDRDGDGKADEQTVIATDYGVGGNPEHQPNGLLHDLDNWIYSANYDKRLRFVNGAWLSEGVMEFGQWGVSHDDVGRLFHNNNTDQLRASLIPPHYLTRNPRYHGAGANEQIAKDQTVWPLHDTAVDRGYVKDIMRPDGTLRNFTAACAPTIYRGGAFPKDFAGNAFVCEPAANLIKRDILTEPGDGTLTAKNAYDGREFLASTYERFRPVNLNVGPDGALYVVDMHHGLIQHKVFLTTYCKEQYLQRELEKHLLTGRIYRIVPDGAKLFDRPHLSTATAAELVKTLAHPNGWWRDTAQRLLVERQDYRAVPLLRKMVTEDKDVVARLHALWTLEGLGVTGPGVLKPLLADPEAKIRAAALRVAERQLSTAAGREAILPAVVALARDADPDVRLQFALTASAAGAPETDAAVVDVLAAGANRPLVRDAVITGIGGRELDFIKRALASPAWTADGAGRPAALGRLAGCVMADASPKRVAELLDLVADQKGWRCTALLDGMQTGVNPRGVPKPVMLPTEPKRFVSLRAGDASAKVDNVLTVIHWPGQPGYVAPKPPAPLTPAEQARFERGAKVYAATCIACHKADGRGQEGLAPPLLESEWALGPPARILRIVTGGLQGPVTVAGHTYAMEMPALKILSDEDVAAVVTYVRRSWEHGASPVDEGAVWEIRTAMRPVPWTDGDLTKAEAPPGRKRPKAARPAP